MQELDATLGSVDKNAVTCSPRAWICGIGVRATRRVLVSISLYHFRRRRISIIGGIVWMLEIFQGRSHSCSISAAFIFVPVVPRPVCIPTSFFLAQVSLGNI